MELLLLRTYYPDGTNGVLQFNNSFVCYTIELPWLNNAKEHSCIPEGKYRLRLRYTKRLMTHLLVQGVKDRDLILIHPANDALKELKGCIAPVTKLTGPGKGDASKMAMEKVKELYFSYADDEPIFITIKNSKNEFHK